MIVGSFSQGCCVPRLELDSIIALVLDVTLVGPILNVFGWTQDVPLPQLEVPPSCEIGGVKAQLLECLRSGFESVEHLWPYAAIDPAWPDQVGSHANLKARDCGPGVIVEDGGAVSVEIRKVIFAA